MYIAYTLCISLVGFRFVPISVLLVSVFWVVAVLVDVWSVSLRWSWDWSGSLLWIGAGATFTMGLSGSGLIVCLEQMEREQ